MNPLAEKDLFALSAYLDDALPQRARRRLEARLAREQDLRQALAELRWARQALRAAPRRPAPRNFTLTRQMAGVRPPVPLTAVWSQAGALLAVVLLAFFSLGSSLRLGAAALPVAERAAEEAPPEAIAPLMTADQPEAAGAEESLPAAAPLAAADKAASAPTVTASPEPPTATPPTAMSSAPAPLPWGRWGLLAAAVFFGGLSWYLRRRAWRRFDANL